MENDKLLLDYLTDEYDPHEVVFIVDGNGLEGDFDIVGSNRNKKTVKCAYYILCYECMQIGVFQDEVFEGRYDKELFDELTKFKSKKFVIVQEDKYLPSLWRLAVQAFLEKNGITDKVDVILFDLSTNECLFSNNLGTVEIRGSYEAYRKLFIQKGKEDLQRYYIPDTSVECFLDINSPKGKFANFLKGLRTDKYGVIWHQCMTHFNKWGICDETIIRIAAGELTNGIPIIKIKKPDEAKPIE